MGLTMGLIPAAGKSTRMGGLQKMLLPIRHSFLLRSRAAALLDAGCSNVFIAANNENNQLIQAAMIGTGSMYITATETMPGTLRAGRQWTGNHRVLMAMADTWWEDEELLLKMNHALDVADVVVGVFQTRTEQRHKLGMCVIDLEDRLIAIQDKPADTHGYVHAWGAVGWNVAFWRHIYPAHKSLSESLNSAIHAKLRIEIVYAQGGYWDCGTLDEYAHLLNYQLGKVTHGT